MTTSQSIHELQKRIVSLEEQLMQAQRLMSLGELTSSMVHEFNNISMILIESAKMVLRQKDETSRTKMLNKILTVANKASKITNAARRAVAMNRKSKLEPTNFAALVEDVLLLLEREMNKYRISVERSFDEKMPEIIADENQITQVVLNLLINARQAMPNGGKLSLKMSYDEENEMIDFIIRDFGCGIPHENLPRIFEPFYTTKSGPDDSGKGGTGLGLASCKAIIEQHQGTIHVKSTVGKGTSFTIKLPTVIRAKLVALQRSSDKTSSPPSREQ